MRRRDVVLLAAVWAAGLLAIWAAHAGTGVVLSVLPDDSVGGDPEAYSLYLQARSRTILYDSAPYGGQVSPLPARLPGSAKPVQPQVPYRVVAGRSSAACVPTKAKP